MTSMRSNRRSRHQERRARAILTPVLKFRSTREPASVRRCLEMRGGSLLENSRRPGSARRAPRFDLGGTSTSWRLRRDARVGAISEARSPPTCMHADVAPRSRRLSRGPAHAGRSRHGFAQSGAVIASERKRAAQPRIYHGPSAVMLPGREHDSRTRGDARRSARALARHSLVRRCFSEGPRDGRRSRRCCWALRACRWRRPPRICRRVDNGALLRRAHACPPWRASPGSSKMGSNDDRTGRAQCIASSSAWRSA